MKLNPIQQEIYNMVINDMEVNKKNYSLLTNNEISKQLNISAFSIRDHVAKLVNKGIFQRVLNYWNADKQFFNRVLYKGIKPE
jgi:DNA-binding Lrp family transcriptional regulator